MAGIYSKRRKSKLPTGREVTKYSTLIEWASTILLIASVALSSFNYYPANIIAGFLGSLGWVIISVSWNKWSLILVNVTLTLLYLSGIVMYCR
jgi:hypothetical protein